MPCGAKGKCKHAYRKPGKDTLHCDIQTGQGGKWDFCAHQYLCGMTKRYELSKEANDCPLPAKEAEKTVSEGNKTIADAEAVTAEEIVENPKPKKTAAKEKTVKKKEAAKNGD